MGNSFVPVANGGHCIPETKRHNSKATEQLDNGDFLGIDDLLDFSDDDIGGVIELGDNNSSPTLPEIQFGNRSSVDRKRSQMASISYGDGLGELCVPCDELAELEWLSNFVEESFSSGDASANFFGSSARATSGFNEDKSAHVVGNKHRFESNSPVSVLETSANSGKGTATGISSSVPGRARSKRCRTAVCFWNTRILSADATASIIESSSTSTVTAVQSSDSETMFTYNHQQQQHRGSSDSLASEKFYQNQSKGQKSGTELARKCLHCGVQRTPQWRAGPMGPKTLCNACGVRYKSGRLLPEYRPAASPTFIESIHSNSHRKVLEMRRQRDAIIPNSHENHCNSRMATTGVC